MKAIQIFFLLAILCLKGFSGVLYEITLRKNGKDETHEVHIGALFSGTEIVAYSPKTEKFVSIFFKRGAKPPKPVIEYWNPIIGRNIKLYKFKETGETLMAIDNPSRDLKSLPNVTKIQIEAIADAD